MEPRNVCVYGSSSKKTPQKYLEASKKLGHLLAQGGHLCINGAGKEGCMGALNDAVQESKGRVRGVIHKRWIVDKVEHPFISDMLVVDGEGLQERKAALLENADCAIALPGGVGTWDELWEVACMKGLGMKEMPVCAVNVDGFYDSFRAQLQRAYDDGLLYCPPNDLVRFEEEPRAALQWCLSQLNSNGATPRPLARKSTRGVSVNGRLGRGGLGWVQLWGGLALTGVLSLAVHKIKA